MTAQIAVLIPTLGRPDKLEQLVENVHATTRNTHRVYLIMERHDQQSIDTADKLECTSIIGDYGSCAKAVNGGYALTSEPFFAVANDDVLFHPAWDVNAMKYFNDSVHVVGLNDGSGDCKCFTIARRAFIQEHSGVYDKPDTPYHDGYVSQCVDTEFAHYAMLRGVWADAPDAVLEHVHWRFGKADRDHPNYVKARETNDRDLDEYNRRRPNWDPGNQTPACVPGGVFA